MRAFSKSVLAIARKEPKQHNQVEGVHYLKDAPGWPNTKTGTWLQASSLQGAGVIFAVKLEGQIFSQTRTALAQQKSAIGAHKLEATHHLKDAPHQPNTGTAPPLVQGAGVIDANKLEAAHYLLRPFLLRRVKGEVESKLPPKVETRINCPLSEFQTVCVGDGGTLVVCVVAGTFDCSSLARHPCRFCSTWPCQASPRADVFANIFFFNGFHELQTNAATAMLLPIKGPQLLSTCQ
eukprot:1133621-Pelagomonas_calceolata.AAC.10